MFNDFAHVLRTSLRFEPFSGSSKNVNAHPRPRENGSKEAKREEEGLIIARQEESNTL